MKRFISLITCLVFGFSCLVLPATKVEADDSATAKAVKELLGALSNYLGDTAKMAPMTDENKIKHILAESKKRVWETTEKQSIGVFKEKVKEYAKQKMQTDIFKKRVTNMLMEAVVEDKNVGALWSKAKVEIASELDSKMNALGHSLDALEVGYNVYKEWNTGGAQKGLRKMGTEIADKISEYFIPGWGYYKLAQSLVIALGEYVMAYAFDTAFEGNMKDLLPVSPESKGFSKWLLNTDVKSYVTREWNEQLAYSHDWYAKFDGNTKTKEEGGEKMLNQMISHLEDLKSKLKKKELIKKELEDKLRAEDEKTRKAEEAVKAVTKKAMEEAEVYLSMIRAFEEKLYGYKKKDAVKDVQKKEAAYTEYISRSNKGQSVVYSPMNKSSIVSALEAVGDEVKEDGIEGYDVEAARRLYEYYLELRDQTISSSTKDIAQKEAAAIKAVENIDKSFRPRYEAKLAEYYKAREEAVTDRLRNELNAINQAWSNATRPYTHAKYRGLRKDQNEDIKVLIAMENAAWMTIKERGMKMQKRIEATINEQSEKLAAAYENLSKVYQEVWAEIEMNLHYKKSWNNPSGCAWEISTYYLPYQPGSYVKALKSFEEERDNILADQVVAAKLHAKQLEAFNKYFSACKTAISEYEAKIPKNLRVIKQTEERAGTMAGFYQVNSFAIYYDYDNGRRRGVISIIDNSIFKGFVIRGDGYGRTTEDWAEYMKENPFKTEEALIKVNKAIDQIKPKIDADKDMKALTTICSIVSDDMLAFEHYWDPDKIQQKAAGLFGIKASGNRLIDPYESEGSIYLEKLKNFYEKNADRIKTLVSLKKSVGNTVLYSSWDYQNHYYPLVDSYAKTPDVIAFYEKTLEEADEKYNKRLEIMNNNLEVAKKRLNDLKKVTGKSLRQIKKELESISSVYKSNIKTLKSVPAREKITEILSGWEELNKKIEEYEKQIDKKGGNGTGTTGLVIGDGGPNSETQRFEVINPCVNGKPASGVGLVTLEKKDVSGGNIEITALLPSVMEYVNIMISEDNGNGWKSIPLDSKLSYSFRVVPDKVYKPILQLKTDDGTTVIVEIFEGIDGIIYKDIDYVQEVQKAVVGMADAYEKRDVYKFMDYVSRDFSGNRSFLEEGIRTDFDVFNNTRLSIYINRVDYSGKNYIAEIKWDKKQIPKKTMQEQRTSGNTTFIFITEGGHLKLKNLRGNLIYATLSPEIAETSGLPSSTVDAIRKARDERIGQQPGAGKVEDDGGTHQNGDPGGASGGSGNGSGGAGGPGSGGGPGSDAILSSNIEQGTFSLTQNKAHPPMSNQGFKFSGKRVITETDMGLVDRTNADFKRREGWLIVGAGNGVKDLGSGSIDSVRDVPPSGYSSGPIGFRERNIYAISMPDGTYALIQSTSGSGWGIPLTTNYRYKYQKNGTRQFN